MIQYWLYNFVLAWCAQVIAAPRVALTATVVRILPLNCTHLRTTTHHHGFLSNVYISHLHMFAYIETIKDHCPYLVYPPLVHKYGRVGWMSCSLSSSPPNLMKTKEGGGLKKLANIPTWCLKKVNGPQIDTPH